MVRTDGDIRMWQAGFVSIIVPCYNHERFIEDNLQSLINQTYKDIELLICDDASTDNTYDIIRGYEDKLKKRFERVIIVHNKKNCGLTCNLNRMLKQAKGEYVKLLAGDDAMTPEAVQVMVSHFNEHSECKLLVANGSIINEKQKYPNFQEIKAVYEETPNFNPEGFLERVAWINEIFAPGVMMRRSVYEKYGDYDENIEIEDLEYWMRLIKTGDIMFDYIPDKLIFYRTNSNSVTSLTYNEGFEKRRRRFHGATMKIFQKYRDDLTNGVYEVVCAKQIMDELRLATNIKMPCWEKELKEEWKVLLQSNGWKTDKKIYYKMRYLRSRLGKFIKQFLWNK